MVKYINYLVSYHLKDLGTTKRRRTQELRRDESRAKILTAAEHIFARDTLAGARTDTIAAEAGVNKALLYYYFKNKEKLYEAVLEEHLREFNVRALSILDAEGSTQELMMKYLNLHFDFISERHQHPGLFQQLISKGGKSPERLFRKYIVPRAEAVQRLLMRGTREGEFRQADPFHTSLSLAALVVFYFSAAPMLQMMGYSDPFTPANLKQRKCEVLAFVQRALFVEKSSK